MPETRAARRRPQMRRMDADHRLQAARRVAEKVHALVRVEIGKIPDRRHRVQILELPEEMGRTRGLEPPTLGTTNRCSNQLSYDRRRKRALTGAGFPTSRFRVCRRRAATTPSS